MESHTIRSRTPSAPLSRARLSAFRRSSALIGTLVAWLALAGVMGCREEPGEASSGAPGEPGPPAIEAPAPPSPDERLAEAVREAMLQAPALARENIQIAVVHQQVFLTGEVSASHLRDEAVVVAGQVPGVLGVQSKISVAR